MPQNTASHGPEIHYNLESGSATITFTAAELAEFRSQILGRALNTAPPEKLQVWFKLADRLDGHAILQASVTRLISNL